MFRFVQRVSVLSPLLLLLVLLCVAFAPLPVRASQCTDDYERILNGSMPYAKAYLDATGRGPEDLGNHRECKLIGPQAHYCVLVADELQNGTIPPLGPGSVPVALGVCAPASCNVSEIAELVEDSMKPWGVNNTLSLTGSCYDVSKRLPAKSIVVLGFVGVLVTVVILGSCIDFVQTRKASKPKPLVQPLTLPTAHVSIQASEGAAETDALLVKSGEAAHAIPAKKPRVSKAMKLLTEILLAFSLQRNVHSFLQVSQSELSALNGLRVFAMFWIIFGHTGEFYVEFIVNRTYVQQFIQREWIYQVFPGAYWNVDTFFYLSGFLVAYGTMGELEHRKGRLSWPLFYIHRLWRLWPTYLFVLLLYIHLSIYVGEGFLWDQYTKYIVQRCDKWWTNALFINNFYPTQFSEQCLGWSWYLANDMQFYIISPLILYAYYRKRWLGWAILAALMAGTMAANVGLLFYFGIPASNPIATYSTEYMDNIYGKPYTRIAPFLIGIGAAWVYRRRAKDLPPMRWRYRFCLYLAAFVLLYCPVFLVNVNPNWSAAEGVLYATAGRISWPLGVALLMHACFCAPKSFLNRVFAADVWAVLARLTFMAYLAHPIVLFTYYLNRDHLLIYTDSDLVFWWVAAVCVSYLVAFAVSMVVEKPVLNLEKILFGAHRTVKPPASASGPAPATSAAPSTVPESSAVPAVAVAVAVPFGAPVATSTAAVAVQVHTPPAT